MLTIERTDHLCRLVSEIVDANGGCCAECGGVAPGDKLLAFTTLRGSRSREHVGTFCCLDCHDIYHGLKPRKGHHNGLPRH